MKPVRWFSINCLIVMSPTSWASIKSICCAPPTSGVFSKAAQNSFTLRLTANAESVPSGICFRSSSDSGLLNSDSRLFSFFGHFTVVCVSISSLRIPTAPSIPVMSFKPVASTICHWLGCCCSASHSGVTLTCINPPSRSTGMRSCNSVAHFGTGDLAFLKSSLIESSPMPNIKKLR